MVHLNIHTNFFNQKTVTCFLANIVDNVCHISFPQKNDEIVIDREYDIEVTIVAHFSLSLSNDHIHFTICSEVVEQLIKIGCRALVLEDLTVFVQCLIDDKFDITLKNCDVRVSEGLIPAICKNYDLLTNLSRMLKDCHESVRFSPFFVTGDKHLYAEFIEQVYNYGFRYIIFNLPHYIVLDCPLVVKTIMTYQGDGTEVGIILPAFARRYNEAYKANQILNIITKHMCMGNNIRQRDWPGFEQALIDNGLEEFL